MFFDIIDIFVLSPPQLTARGKKCLNIHYLRKISEKQNMLFN
ncbi:hypothetical protein OIU74_011496 [Salix koriyanagi]|uniref:Uncharacterized protein n=1 Tax=Salix koriyanagi TaxID=2511006 RepID=A0A9Q0YUI2_9ROSI|nr:hypothetical protein OIU74_011496 [Salix koriyanagi]